MKFSNKKVLIFDFDGTLIDSVPDLCDALNAMLVQLGRKSVDEARMREWVGNGAKTLVSRALCGKREFTQEELASQPLKEALEIFLAHYAKQPAKKTCLYPGVKESLTQLFKKGYTLTIVTNKPSAFVAPILEALSIKELFALYLGADDLPQQKPHPLPLLHTIEKLGYNAKEAVMIGDSKNDILAAHAAAMESVAVSYGYNYGEDIADCNPTVVIETFNELLEVL